jgi:hypothetical protein
MPEVKNGRLTLTTVSQNGTDRTTMNVTFDAVFTPFERQLAGLGMTFDRHIEILGVDATSHRVLYEWDPTNLPVTAGAGAQTIPVNTSRTVDRSDLQDDPGLGDNDEIGCNIRIHAQGMPPVFTEDKFTAQVILAG